MEDAHAAGAYAEDYERRHAEAEALRKTLRAEGSAGRAKANRLDNAKDFNKKWRKRKRDNADAVAREETELKEWILMLRERLGNGATKIVLCVFVRDKYGGLLETKDYKADVAALAKLEAKEGLTSEDKKKIKRDRNALAAKRSRARKRVEAKKETRHVKALEGRVEELEKEVCLLEDLLSVI